MARSAEAREFLAALDAELAESARRLNRQVPWNAKDRAVLEMVGDMIDRKVDLSARYEEAEDTKLRVKLSAELRLLEAALARLLKQIETSEPAPVSRRTQMARKAAEARWRRDIA